MRDIKPTPWRLLRSLQAVLWAVLVLCVGNALACRTVNPLDLPLADTADTAKTRAVAEAKSAEILALEEMAESAETDVGEELRTPYSYVGNGPLVGVDPTGMEQLSGSANWDFQGMVSWVWNSGTGNSATTGGFVETAKESSKLGYQDIKQSAIQGLNDPLCMTLYGGPLISIGSKAAGLAIGLRAASLAASSAEFSGFSSAEIAVIKEAGSIFKSPEFGKILAAQQAGTSATVTIGGRVIQYEPGLPASGMTMFGENGFLIGREAFASHAELGKTVLHELYRLSMSASSKGVSGALAAQETLAAWSFAQKAIGVIKR